MSVFSTDLSHEFGLHYGAKLALGIRCRITPSAQSTYRPSMDVEQLKVLIKMRFQGNSSSKISKRIGVSESHIDRALVFMSYHGPYALLTHPSLKDQSRTISSEEYTLIAEYALKHHLSYDRTSCLFMASRKVVTRYIQARKLFDTPYSNKEPPFPPHVSLDRAFDPMHPQYNEELIMAMNAKLVAEFGLDLLEHISKASTSQSPISTDFSSSSSPTPLPMNDLRHFELLERKAQTNLLDLD